MFVVAIQLFDSRNGQPVRALPNHVRFFARIIERDGCAMLTVATSMRSCHSTQSLMQAIYRCIV